MKIDISKCDKAAVLAALYNAARPMGMGFLQARDGDMTTEQARECLALGDDSARMFNRPPRELYFDYLYGRPLKSNLTDDIYESALYDRDNRSALEALQRAGLPAKIVE